MNPWLSTLLEIAAKKGPIGMLAMRAALLEKCGENAARWFDAECGVPTPRYEHTVDTTGVVTSTEVA